MWSFFFCDLCDYSARFGSSYELPREVQVVMCDACFSIAYIEAIQDGPDDLFRTPEIVRLWKRNKSNAEQTPLPGTRRERARQRKTCGVLKPAYQPSQKQSEFEPTEQYLYLSDGLLIRDTAQGACPNCNVPGMIRFGFDSGSSCPKCTIGTISPFE